MFRWIQPKDGLDERDLQRGMRMLIADGLCSQAMGALTGGAVLVAFAVMLGASNTVIGLLAAIGPLTQMLQIPTVFLVDSSGLRKALVLGSSLFSRLAWLVVAAIPFYVAADYQVAVLLTCLFIYFGLGTISGCAFNSWMRDLVPDRIRGRFFGKRLAIAHAAGATLTLATGIAALASGSIGLNDEAMYATFFAAGGGFGLLGLYYLARIPEPRMEAQPSRGLMSILYEPFAERNYRQLLIFLGCWNFAVNLAAPFFTVYMLKRLDISMAVVLGLSVVSQIVNVIGFHVWGILADRFSNKSVLIVSGPLFILSLLIWPFLELPEQHVLTMPLLIAIHVLTGISTAGVTLCSSNIAANAAPYGKATIYLASNALVNGIAATIAPILAGMAADWFEGQELALSLKWVEIGTASTLFDVRAFNLRGMDFLFVLGFVLGWYSLHRLLAVREEGEVAHGVVLAEFYGEVRKAVRHVSNVAGLRQLTYFPYARLKESLATSRTRPQPWPEVDVEIELESPEEEAIAA